MIRELSEENFWSEVFRISHQGLTIFAGAGVSATSPCSLPAFNTLLNNILDEYLSYIHRVGLLDNSFHIEINGEQICGINNESRKLKSISPDYSLLLLTLNEEKYISNYISQVFRTRGFNQAHDLIIKILLLHHSNNLITPNFDTAFENCISRNFADEKIQKFVGVSKPSIETIASKRSFIKVHGCAIKPSSIVYTLVDEHKLYDGTVNLIV